MVPRLWGKKEKVKTKTNKQGSYSWLKAANNQLEIKLLRDTLPMIGYGLLIIFLHKTQTDLFTHHSHSCYFLQISLKSFYVTKSWFWRPWRHWTSWSLGKSLHCLWLLNNSCTRLTWYQDKIEGWGIGRFCIKDHLWWSPTNWKTDRECSCIA